MTLFRANALFRNFEIKSPADRALIYLILFIGDCLGRIAQGESARHSAFDAVASGRLMTLLQATDSGWHPARTWGPQDALKNLSTHALSQFALPGEPGFPLNQVFSGPAAGDRVGSDALRGYLTHARQETVQRLIESYVYSPKDLSTEGGKKPSKWWMSFSVSLRVVPWSAWTLFRSWFSSERPASGGPPLTLRLCDLQRRAFMNKRL